MTVKYGINFSLECMDSSMAINLCFWDGSFIPLTFNWKVAGIEVLSLQASVSIVADLGTDDGNC